MKRDADGWCRASRRPGTDAAGRLTAAGDAEHEAIEEATDRVESGMLPMPNPVGLAWPT